MSKNQLSDDQLLKMITGTEPARELGLHHIFQNQDWINSVKQQVLQNRGTEIDSEDTFQETVIIFDRSLRRGTFKGDSNLKTYFVGIAKKVWWGHLRKKIGKDLNLEQIEDQAESVEAHYISTEKKEFLWQALEKTGQRCQQLLELYMKQYSYQEIAERLAFSSAELAKKEGYRCRMKLRDFFKTNPEWLNRVK